LVKTVAKMTISFWLDDASNSDVRLQESCDVAIIGGGIIGCGCAHYLSASTDLKVTLIESQTLGAGTTGRNGGFVVRGIEPYYSMAIKYYGKDKSRFLYHFAEQNQIAIKEFAKRFGDHFDFAQCGSYSLASSLEELDELAASATLMAEDGFDVEFLSGDPIDRDFYGALLNPADIALNPVKFVRALIAHSEATVYENESVVKLESIKKNGPILVKTSRRQIMAQKVLIATNAYTPIFEPFFADKMKTGRNQIIVTAPLAKQILDKICNANYGYEYFRQLPDRRLLLGGCRQLFMEAESGYADVVTRPVQMALENYLKDRFPEIVGVPIAYRWSGLISNTADELPLVGELKHLPNAYAAVAFNGHVLDYGLQMSRLLIDVMLEGKSPQIFDIERDQTNKQLEASFSQTG
jgi:gamma-glutamylputrescine oxidase